MGVDINRVRSLLSVNGLGAHSAPEDISEVLRSANYTPEEVKIALALLAQPAPIPPDATEADGTMRVIKPGIMRFIPSKPIATLPKIVPNERKTSSYPAVPGQVVSEHAGKIEPHLLVPALILALLFYAALAYFAWRPLTTIGSLIEGTSDPLMMFGVTALAAFVLMTVVGLFISSWLARFLYKTETYLLWLLGIVGTYTIVWFLFLFVLLPIVLEFITIPEGLGFAISLLIGISAQFIHVAYVLGCLFALVLAARGWKHGGGGRRGVIGSVLVSVIALLILIYVSGALAYPARAFKVGFLCEGISSSYMRTACHEELKAVPAL